MENLCKDSVKTAYGKVDDVILCRVLGTQNR